MAILALPLWLLLLQAPGDGWALVNAPAHEVRTLYWDLFQTTEVWVTLFPAEPQPRVRLVFQALFAGREAKGPAKSLTVRALLWWQPPAEEWIVIREPSLRFVIDGRSLDLTGPGGCSALAGPGAGCFLLKPCEDCLVNGVAVGLEPTMLRDLAQAKAIEGTALGYPIMLSNADRLAVAEFAERVGVSTR